MKAAFLTAFFLVASPATLAGDRLSELNHSFKVAKSESERVRVAVRAIDAGLICFGCPISNVDKIFATSHAKLDQGRHGFDGFYTGMVYLKPEFDFLNRPDRRPRNAPDSDSAARLDGWYLWLKFTSQGQIVNYHMTNVVKPI